jgi:S1-C subfamily serine protease
MTIIGFKGGGMRKIHVAAAFAVCLWAVLAAPAQAFDRAEDVLKAVVKIKATIPEGARTAANLGKEREGHGILIDDQNHILTTGYLIIESESIEVTAAGGRKAKAAFVGYDHATGFGLMKADSPLGVQPIEFGRSADIEEGAPVLVAGYGGLESAAGARVVARREFAGYWEYLLEHAIYTAPAYAKFAGAALIGADGRLLGVGSLFTRLPVPGVGVLPCNVFIPIDLLQPILNDLIARGRPSAPARPWLGVNADESHGRVFLTRITGDGPAEAAGLETDDLVLKVNGEPVDGLTDFYRKVWATGNAGAEVSLTILKGVEPREVKVRSADRNSFLMMRPRSTI